MFRELLVAAWEDGTLTRDARRLLRRASERLGISAADAQRLEREVVEA